ncbi:MAG TPA: hypothetical protein ENN35_06555 [Deltaproteobacteria bacterium]|nr:hypothetical protein [Deltaproteobacteria bacterium]
MEEKREQAADREATWLKRSFEDFNIATERMQEAFVGLEQRFKLINLELEQKNRELERVLDEKEKIRSYLETILENLTSGVVVTGSDGRIRLMNGRAEKFSGRGEKWHEMLIGEIFPGLENDGINLSVEPLQAFRFRENGRMLEVSSSIMKQGNGSDVETIFVIRDVTRLARLEEMEKRSEKFAALEEMAATIAHEIRNPLGGIELFASLLMKEPGNERSPDRAYEIIKAVKHVNNRISNLLLFTKRPQPLTKKVHINHLVEEVLSFAAPIIENERISLSVEYAEGEPWITGDSELLKQVLLNLILNALQAMPREGRLGLETRLIASGGAAEQDGNARDVELIVTDTGEGIPSESVKRIFDPFFTTREGGVGLGLAIVHNIIDMHGGLVAAERRDGGGTVMAITLPLAEPAGGPHEMPPPQVE